MTTSYQYNNRDPLDLCNPHQKGRWAELAVASYLTGKGLHVAMPWSGRADIIAWDEHTELVAFIDVKLIHYPKAVNKAQMIDDRLCYVAFIPENDAIQLARLPISEEYLRRLGELGMFTSLFP